MLKLLEIQASNHISGDWLGPEVNSILSRARQLSDKWN